MKPKDLIGVIIILGFYLLGELISYAISDFLPGNVIGMVLLFVALQTRLVPESSVAKVCSFLTRYMAIMFLPPAMGLLAIYELVGENALTIVLSTMLSAMLVLVVVGKMQDKIGRGDETID